MPVSEMLKDNDYYEVEFHYPPHPISSVFQIIENLWNVWTTISKISCA